LVVTEKTY